MSTTGPSAARSRARHPAAGWGCVRPEPAAAEDWVRGHWRRSSLPEKEHPHKSVRAAGTEAEGWVDGDTEVGGLGLCCTAVEDWARGCTEVEGSVLGGIGAGDWVHAEVAAELGHWRTARSGSFACEDRTALAAAAGCTGTAEVVPGKELVAEEPVDRTAHSQRLDAAEEAAAAGTAMREVGTTDVDSRQPKVPAA